MGGFWSFWWRWTMAYFLLQFERGEMMATVGVLMVRVWDARYGEIMAMVGVL